jgi:hypothetical protein
MIGASLIYAAGAFSGFALATGVVFFLMLRHAGELPDDPSSPSA